MSNLKVGLWRMRIEEVMIQGHSQVNNGNWSREARKTTKPMVTHQRTTQHGREAGIQSSSTDENEPLCALNNTTITNGRLPERFTVFHGLKPDE